MGDRKVKEKLQTKFSTRQHMLSKDFEIYYYTDTFLTKVGSHIHNYYEIYFFLEGNVSIDIEGTVHPLKHGDIVIIPPEVEHYTLIHNKETPYRRFVFWISCEYLQNLIDFSPSYGYLRQIIPSDNGYIFHNDMIAFNTIQGKVFRLIEETRTNRYGKDAKVFLCVSDLILHLNRIIYEQNHEKNQYEQQKLYENIIYYIEDHLSDDLSLDVLAKEFFINKYYIAHLFKDNIGISIHQYIRKKRLAACKDSIRSGLRISEAYLLFGFKDYSAFYRAFKAEYGMTPKEYAVYTKVTPS